MARKNLTCAICEKKFLSKNEIGINKKLLGAQPKKFFCLECLANYLEVDAQDILDKIEEFKNDGCKLFE